jgi:ABC-type glycerol-3-phosphate transport system substrate-binding protein
MQPKSRAATLLSAADGFAARRGNEGRAARGERRVSTRPFSLLGTRHSLLARLCALGALTGLAGGCGSSSSKSVPSDKALEAAVTVSCPGELAATIVARYGQAWSIQKHVRLQVVRYDPKAGPDAGPGADLWIIPAAELAHWAVAGNLYPVPEPITREGSPFAWERLLRSNQKLLTWDRQAFALPVLGDALLCFYRQDLLADTSIREHFKKSHHQDLPSPDTGPRTWQDFVDMAEYFNKQTRPGISHPCASLPALPADDDELDQEFYSVVLPFAHRGVREDDRKPPPDDEAFSFHYDLATDDARIASPAFKHGLKLLQRLQACRPQKEAGEAPARFLRGEAVLCLASPSWIGRFQNEPRLQGKVGFCRPPGSRIVFDYQSGQEQPVNPENYVPYLGARTLLAVVPRRNVAPEAAFDLAAALGGPDISREIVIEPEWGGGVFRRDHLQTEAGWQSFGLGSRTESLLQILRDEVVHPQVKNPVMRLRIPDQQAHRAALLNEVRAALLHGKDAAAALQDALTQWNRIDQKKDRRQRRSQYRLSLGLSGDV